MHHTKESGANASMADPSHSSDIPKVAQQERFLKRSQGANAQGVAGNYKS